MAGRFQKLYTAPQDLYVKGCPILIEAGALQKDTETGNILAQLKMKNIGEKPIASCKIRLHAFENNGNEIEGIDAFSYLDLNVKKGVEFGTKVPIYLSNAATRSFSPEIIEIVFSDNSVDEKCYKDWSAVPGQRSIESVLNDSKLVKQYSIDFNSEAKYVPEITDGLFLCTCGAANLESNAMCCRCGSSYEDLVAKLDIDKLREETETRLATEKAANKKKRIIAAALGALVLLIGVVAIRHSVLMGQTSELPCNLNFGDPQDVVQEKINKYSDTEVDNGRETAHCISYAGYDYWTVTGEVNNNKLTGIALYPICYTHDVEDPDWNSILKTLGDRYGEPERDAPKYYIWDSEGFWIGVIKDADRGPVVIVFNEGES